MEFTLHTGVTCHNSYGGYPFILGSWVTIYMEVTFHTGVMGHNSYGGHISYWGHGVILQMWVMVTQHTRLIYISYSIFGGVMGS